MSYDNFSQEEIQKYFDKYGFPRKPKFDPVILVLAAIITIGIILLVT